MRLTFALTLLLAGGVTTGAHGEVISFTLASAVGPPVYLSGTTYVEGDYQIAFAGHPGGIVIQPWSSVCSPACADNGGAYLLNLTMDLLVLSRLDGRPFTLLSFDGAESFQSTPEQWASAIRVAGKAAAPVDFVLDFVQDGPGSLQDFQTFVLPRSLGGQMFYAFSASVRDQDYSIDNLRVTDTAPVPEPASLVLLGSGLLCVGVQRWRKHRPMHPTRQDN
jgi:hypothetical protein